MAMQGESLSHGVRHVRSGPVCHTQRVLYCAHVCTEACWVVHGCLHLNSLTATVRRLHCPSSAFWDLQVCCLSLQGLRVNSTLLSCGLGQEEPGLGFRPFALFSPSLPSASPRLTSPSSMLRLLSLCFSLLSTLL